MEPIKTTATKRLTEDVLRQIALAKREKPLDVLLEEQAKQKGNSNANPA